MLAPTPTLVPPPQQLGLPPPLTPPPKGARPRMTPMKSTPPPMLRQEPIEPEQEVRWWHDWLCGCSEGPDRGGDNQVGKILTQVVDCTDGFASGWTYESF